MPEQRRYPPPWDIEEANASCFIVKDNNGQTLAYVCFESDAGRRTAANLLTGDEPPHRGEHREAAGASAAAKFNKSLRDRLRTHSTASSGVI